MTRRIPWITLGIVILSALVYALPNTSLLVYDRNAILAGEWWRVVTGHWVHFSPQHFFYDTAAFGMTGWMIESRGYKNFGWLCAFATVAISGSMLLCEPRMQICGGLSGLATAAVVFLALNGLAEPGAWRWICGAALCLCAAKLSVELMTGRFVVWQASASFAPVPSNHIAGALTALGVYVWARVKTPRLATNGAKGRIVLGTDNAEALQIIRQ